MSVFAPVNSKNSGGYFVASHQGPMAWHGIPHDLARVLEDVRQNGEAVKEVSIGLDGDWFLRTNIHRAWKTERGQADTSSNVELCIQLTELVAMGPYMIQSFTFVPDRTGFVAILYNADGSCTHCAWHNVPPMLAVLLSRKASKGVSRVAVGVNGSYVLVLNNGRMWWSGIPESLGQLLDNAQRTGRRVETVSLSLVSPSWYFVEFADGITAYVLPQDWHPVINKFTARTMGHTGPQVLTSTNPTTSPPPPYPLDAQYGAFSPINAHGSHPRCGPFEPNRFPAPVLTPAPQTVPNVTYMHQIMPSQPQTAPTTQKYDSTLRKCNEVTNLAVSVLKALKLARAFGDGDDNGDDN